jgi:hypothetical protein
MEEANLAMELDGSRLLAGQAGKKALNIST